jgi:hypothetical protein
MISLRMPGMTESEMRMGSFGHIFLTLRWTHTDRPPRSSRVAWRQGAQGPEQHLSDAAAVDPNSTARKTSCGRTGCRIGCSNHSTILSTTAAMPGTRSSISPGRSCPSPAAIGQAWVIQCEDWYKPLDFGRFCPKEKLAKGALGGVFGAGGPRILGLRKEEPSARKAYCHSRPKSGSCRPTS